MAANSDGLTVGLLGFGTVGKAVARILCERSDRSPRLVGICTRRPADARSSAPWLPADVLCTDDIETLLKHGPQVIVEVMGGLEPARTWIEGALRAGRSVVTANKQVVAEHGRELTAIARHTDRAFLFEAAVGGAVPVIRGVQDGLGSDRLTRIVGVVNGTCNFILTRMTEKKISFDDAVCEAQANGFAEADPSADLDGLDARAKLSILATLGFDEDFRPSDVPVESIRPLDAGDLDAAGELGRVARQVAWAERSVSSGTDIGAGVLPAFVSDRSWLARAAGAQNIVVVTGERAGQTVFAGQGAGGDATAVAVVSDLLTIASGAAAPKCWPASSGARISGDFVAPHYVRVAGLRAGGAGVLRSALDRAGFTLDRVLTKPDRDGTRWAATLTACSHAHLGRSLAECVPAACADGEVVSLPLFDADR